jgi:hypothetical protein
VKGGNGMGKFLDRIDKIKRIGKTEGSKEGRMN